MSGSNLAGFLGNMFIKIYTFYVYIIGVYFNSLYFA